MFVVDGKGGHPRLVPMSGRFFASVAHYLDSERPAAADDQFVFPVLKGRRRGRRLTAKGMEEILTAARRRAGLEHATCHELRHTCLTRLREAGMALEAVQAQAGHRSIESTRIYLHLANGWQASTSAVPKPSMPKRWLAPRRCRRHDSSDGRGRGTVPDPRWADIAARAPRLPTTMHLYLDQMALSLRPSSVDAVELALRSLPAFSPPNITRQSTTSSKRRSRNGGGDCSVRLGRARATSLGAPPGS